MGVQLSDKQQSFLTFLEDWIDRAGRAPSLRQAAQALGISHAAVAQYLRTLEEKGCLQREGRYSRRIRLLHRPGRAAAGERGREVPVIGRIAAGLPMYAQPEWEGSVVVDRSLFKSPDLFALRIKGDSMVQAGIRDGDMAICEPRQFARNGEIVVALLDGQEATVKRFYLRPTQVELRPENSGYEPRLYDFDRVLVQGKVVGLIRGPEGMAIS